MPRSRLRKMADDLPAKIKKLRTGKGLTHSELARKLGVDRRTVMRWENGKCCPSPSNILLMAKVFKVSSDYFTDGISIDELLATSRIISNLSSRIDLLEYKIFGQRHEHTTDKA